MSSLTRQQLEKWLKRIGVNDSMVLDIGGAQNAVRGRTKSWDVRRYDILDLPKPHEFNFDVDISGDIEDIDFKDTKYKGLEYDIAFCLEVSEYWIEPLKALRNINKFLKKGGKLYISFHFVYPIHNPEGLDCLRYTRFGIMKLMEKAGFKIKEIVPRVAERTDMMKFYLNEEMRPNRNYEGRNEVGYLVEAIKI